MQINPGHLKIPLHTELGASSAATQIYSSTVTQQFADVSINILQRLHSLIVLMSEDEMPESKTEETQASPIAACAQEPAEQEAVHSWLSHR